MSLVGYVAPTEALLANPMVDLEAVSNGPIDWRTRGVFNPIRDQSLGGRSECGSCWAFSSVAAVESHHAIKYNTLPNLSEQQLVDCATSYGSYGCHGGFYQSAFNYLKDYGAQYGPGYPYVGAD
jgi:C1A family cysteine protease